MVLEGLLSWINSEYEFLEDGVNFYGSAIADDSNDEQDIKDTRDINFSMTVAVCFDIDSTHLWVILFKKRDNKEHIPFAFLAESRVTFC